MGGRGWVGWSGVKGGKWDNSNSIINKYIFLKRDTTKTTFTNKNLTTNTDLSNPSLLFICFSFPDSVCPSPLEISSLPAAF